MKSVGEQMQVSKGPVVLRRVQSIPPTASCGNILPGKLIRDLSPKVFIES